MKKRRERIAKEIKRGDKSGRCRGRRLGENRSLPRRRQTGADRRRSRRRKTHCRSQFFLLTDKPTIFACNVKETDLATADQNPYVLKVREYVKTHLACEAVVISAQIESDLIDLAPDEAEAFLKELGVQESGVGALIRATYHLLGLRTYSHRRRKRSARLDHPQPATPRPKAAGVIHSDFERGFIKAETVAYDDLVQCGSVAAARDKGLYRMEGKEYVVDDGDVMLFKFNV